MKTSLYGDVAVEIINRRRKEGYGWIVARGDLDLLHDIYNGAIDKGAKPVKVSHPLNKHKRVLDGIDRDERFDKGYISYSGIVNRPCRAFTLKAEYREGGSQ